jgi:hypothetical protein
MRIGAVIPAKEFGEGHWLDSRLGHRGPLLPGCPLYVLGALTSGKVTSPSCRLQAAQCLGRTSRKAGASWRHHPADGRPLLAATYAELNRPRDAQWERRAQCVSPHSLTQSGSSANSIRSKRLTTCSTG